MKKFLHSGALPAPSCYSDGYAADVDEYVKLPRANPFDSSPDVADLTPFSGVAEYYKRDTDQVAKDLYSFVDFMYGCALHHYLVHKEFPEEYRWDFTTLCGQGEGLFLDKEVFVEGVLKALIKADNSFRFGSDNVAFCFTKERGTYPVLTNKGKSVAYDKMEYILALNKVLGELYSIWAFLYECKNCRPHTGYILTNKSMYKADENGHITYVGGTDKPFNLKTFSNLMGD